MKEYNGIATLLFTLLFSAGVMFLDFTIAPKMFHQYASQAYLTTTGTIIHCASVQHNSKQAPACDVEYSYKIEGLSYSGSRIRYFNPGADPEWAADMTAKHQSGSQIKIFYNPNDPADSLLSVGLHGDDLMLLPGFIFPINLVLLGLLIVVARWLYIVLLSPLAGGVKVQFKEQVVCVYLPRFLPILFTLYTTGAISLFVTIVIGISIGTHPPVRVVESFILLLFGVGLVIYIWRRHRLYNGDDTLIINKISNQVSLPKTFGRSERILIDCSNVTGVIVETVSGPSGKGGFSFRYSVILKQGGSASKSYKLADWQDNIKAEAFVFWLRIQLNI